MVGILLEQPSTRLLKHIVRCYLRLSDNLRARDALKKCVPKTLTDGKTFEAALKDDATTQRWLANLMYNMDNTGNAGPLPGGPLTH